MYNTGAIVKRAMEGSNGMSRTVATPSPVTINRIAAEKTLEALAVQNNVTVDAVLTTLLKDPATQQSLIYYVRSKMESPFPHPMKLAMQAALMRLADIATIAKALGISDAEALVVVEQAEYEAIKNNNPDGGILPIDVQACLVIMIDELLSQAGKAGLTADTASLVTAIKATTGDSFDGSLTSLLYGITTTPDNADGDPDNTSWIDGIFGDNSSSAPDPLAGLGGAAPSTGGILAGSGYSPTTPGGGGMLGADDPTLNGTAPTTNGADNSSGIFGWINTAVNAIKGVTTALPGLGKAAGGVLNTVNAGVSKIGGNSINNSSLPLIIGGGLLLILIVIIVIYANRRK